MNLFLLVASVVLALCVSVPASPQTAVVLNRDVSGDTKPAYGAWLPNLAAPGGIGTVPAFLRPDLPNYDAGSIANPSATPLPPIAHEGGLAIDQESRIVYATDGTSFLSQDSHSVYGSVTTAPTATLPLAGWPGSHITGLAVSPAAGILYICDGFLFQARSKT